MGEAPYPWPVRIWFCDYCGRAAGVDLKPQLCCGADSFSSVLVAPAFHWEDENSGLV